MPYGIERVHLVTHVGQETASSHRHCPLLLLACASSAARRDLVFQLPPVLLQLASYSFRLVISISMQRR